MKKLVVLCLLLWGCQSPQYHLYVFYAKTCPVCQSFISEVIPLLNEQYGHQMVITTFDIDEQTSRDNYQKICLMLEDYPINDKSGSIPFIVLDGYFAKVGYQITQQDLIIEAIENAIEGKALPNQLYDVYTFQEGQYFYKED